MIPLTDEQRANVEKVLAVLRGLPDEQVDMSWWFVGTGSAYPRKSLTFPVLPENRGKAGCGTTACLAGWACVVCTPAIETPDGNRVVLPIEWLEKKNLSYNSVLHPLSYEKVPGVGSMKAADLGRYLLGSTLGEYFSATDGDPEGALSDREWVITLLEAALAGTLKDPKDDGFDGDYFDDED